MSAGQRALADAQRFITSQETGVASSSHDGCRETRSEAYTTWASQEAEHMSSASSASAQVASRRSLVNDDRRGAGHQGRSSIDNENVADARGDSPVLSPARRVVHDAGGAGGNANNNDNAPAHGADGSTGNNETLPGLYGQNLAPFADLTNFEHCPRAALHVYHHNSGLLHEYETGFNTFEIPTADEMAADVEAAVEDFHNQVDQEGGYVACAGCGELYSERDTEKVNLGDPKLSNLERTADYKTVFDAMSPMAQAAHHTLRCGEKLLAVAPHLIYHGKGHFCKKCLKSAAGQGQPNHTRFLDFDYGISYLHNKVFQASLPQGEKNTILCHPHHLFTIFTLPRSSSHTSSFFFLPRTLRL